MQIELRSFILFIMVKYLKANVFPTRDHLEVPLRGEVRYLAVWDGKKEVRSA